VDVERYVDPASVSNIASRAQLGTFECGKRAIQFCGLEDLRIGLRTATAVRSLRGAAMRRAARAGPGRGAIRDFDAAAAGIDVDTPNVARIYDYALGGKDNYPADRAAMHKLLESSPVYIEACQQSCAFLGRIVQEAAAAGIRQFLDIGSGLPTQQNVHEIAPRRGLAWCTSTTTDASRVVLRPARPAPTMAIRICLISFTA
jgi:hypothetical protein